MDSPPLILEHRDPSHLYCIQSEETYGYFAGIGADGKQLLLGLYCPDLVAICFDEAGNLLEMKSRNLPFLQLSGVYVDGVLIEGQVRTYNIYDSRIPGELESWKAHLGFKDQLIRVKKFSLANGIVIQDYPDHFNEVLADPDSPREEIEGVIDSAKQWRTQGQFVLVWGNDYWVEGDGHVSSS